MRFSDLTSEFPAPTNRLYTRFEELKTQTEILDMVQARPGDIGAVFPREALDESLRDASRRTEGVYRPDPLGRSSARDAIAAYYDTPRVRPEHILLTPGSSIAYWYAFKLLCNVGDNVLCPVPSYPLFDYIARLAGVEIRPYKLDGKRGWSIDLDHLEAQVSSRTRAITLISPHNPTGAVASPEQIDGLVGIADRNRLAILSDEVFHSFVFHDVVGPRPLETEAPLVFSLDGFSKMYALPQMKLGWMAVSGEETLVRKAMATLELIADTFLPVNELIQYAVPDIFNNGGAFLEEYRERVRACRDVAVQTLGSRLVSPPAGGFYLVVPCRQDEEGLALELLEADHVLVHPGYFYDIEGSHLVFSFLKGTDELTEVLQRIRARLDTG